MNKFNKLSKAEMKNVLGGVVDGSNYNCKCCDQVGSWSGNYSSQQDADASIALYCRTGGECIAG